MQKSQWFPKDIRLIAVAISLAISLLAGIFRSTPNDDAFTYIRTAEIFLNEGLTAAFAHYEWATYSILIGTVHRLTGLEFFSAAYLINALFFGLLVYSFISIVKELDDSFRTQVLAAIAILLYPQLNEFRHEIIRDIGFWSFSLFAISQYMVFTESFRFRNMAFFCAALLVAFTFRSEAVVYLLAIPVSLLFDSRLDKNSRTKYGLIITASSIGSLILLALVLNLAGLNLVQLSADVIATYAPFLSDTIFPTNEQSLELSRAIFGEYAANYSNTYLTLFMLTGLTAILLAKLFNGIGGPFVIILITGLAKKMLNIPRHNFLPLATVLIVNLTILLGFIIVTRFLASRYAMLLSLVLALLVPVVLNRVLIWIESLSNKRAMQGALGALLIYCFIDSFVSFGYNKNYIYEAAQWVNDNSTEDTQVVTNDNSIAYFSGRVEDYDIVQKTLSSQQILQSNAGDLIVIESNIDMQQLLSTEAIKSRIELVKYFPNEGDQRLLVYRRLTD